jgi:hypothetical protein
MPIQSLRAFEERLGGVARLAGWSVPALSGLEHVGSPVKYFVIGEGSSRRIDSRTASDADFRRRKTPHDRCPRHDQASLPLPLPALREEVSEEAGRLITNRQALCRSCGRTIDLVGEQMLAVINKVHEALSRGGTDGDSR